jgi:hypothetical protein
MNGGTIRRTTLPMDGTARPWTGGYHEWVTIAAPSGATSAEPEL